MLLLDHVRARASVRPLSSPARPRVRLSVTLATRRARMCTLWTRADRAQRITAAMPATGARCARRRCRRRRATHGAARALRGLNARLEAYILFGSAPTPATDASIAPSPGAAPVTSPAAGAAGAHESKSDEAEHPADAMAGAMAGASRFMSFRHLNCRSSLHASRDELVMTVVEGACQSPTAPWLACPHCVPARACRHCLLTARTAASVLLATLPPRTCAALHVRPFEAEALLKACDWNQVRAASLPPFAPEVLTPCCPFAAPDLGPVLGGPAVAVPPRRHQHARQLPVHARVCCQCVCPPRPCVARLTRWAAQ